MKEPCFRRFSFLAVALLVLAPVFSVSSNAKQVSTSTTTTTPTASTSAGTSAAPAGVSTATSSVSVPVVTVSPPPPAPAVPPAKSEPSIDVLTVGDVTLSDLKLSQSKDYIDVLVTIKNSGKFDERVIGAGTSWTAGDVVQVTKDKAGKEKEAPVSQDIEAGKSIELSRDKAWIRIKDVQKVKGATVMPVAFYFRHSPNANMKGSLAGSKGVLDWFKN